MLIGKYQINIKINNFIFEIDIRESIERKTYFIREYEKYVLGREFSYTNIEIR